MLMMDSVSQLIRASEAPSDSHVIIVKSEHQITKTHFSGTNNLRCLPTREKGLLYPKLPYLPSAYRHKPTIYALS
jgi:hypothetical protein